MAARTRNRGSGDAAVRELLKRYDRPVSFHEVRARFMGNIATPDTTASPLREIRVIWGDELPVFEGDAEAESFFEVLLQGLWNRLAKHRKRTDPFKLVRVRSAPAAPACLARLARVRRQELEGFIDGLFVSREEMDLPETARRALGLSRELRGLFAATEELARKPSEETDAATVACPPSGGPGGDVGAWSV